MRQQVMKRDQNVGAPRSGTRIPNSLLALGSAAVLAIYSAGNLRTLEAAHQFDDDGGGRRRPIPSGADSAAGAAGAPVATDDAAGAPDLRAAPAESDAGQKPAGSAQVAAQPAMMGNTVSAADAGAPLTPATDHSTASVDGANGSTIRAAPSSVATAGDAAADVSKSRAVKTSGVTAAPSPADTPKVEAAKPGVNAPAAATEPVKPEPLAKTEPAKTELAKTELAKTELAKAQSTKSDAVKTDIATTEAPKGGEAASDTSGVKALWRDGSYTGWGTSRHGNIEATVVIEDGHITSATISRCLTRYSCSWINHLQQQVVTRQSPDVDYVSGATQSANAFYYAVFEALQKAK